MKRYLFDPTTEVFDDLKSGNYAQALYNVAQTPADRIAHDIVVSQYNEGKKAVDAFKDGDYQGALGHGMGALLPVVGPTAAQAGEQIRSGDVAGGIGSGLGVIAGVVGPELAAKGVGYAAGKIAPKGTAAAEGLYQTALKPSVDLDTQNIQQLVRTGLDNRIAISPGGLDRLQGIIGDISNQVRNIISTGAKNGATIDPAAVAQRVNNTKQIFLRQVDRDADLNSIQGVSDRWMSAHSTPGTPPQTLTNAAGQPILDASGKPIQMPGTPAQPKPIPVDEAQAIKQGTYQRLRGKYGEASSAEIEAQKALARGINEELMTQFPELKSLNSREGSLINLEEPLMRAINRMGNKEPVGLLPTIAMTGAAEAAGAGGVATAGLMSKILADQAWRSRFAVALDMASRKTGSLAGKPFQVKAARMGQITSAIDQYVGALQQSANSGAADPQ